MAPITIKTVFGTVRTRGVQAVPIVRKIQCQAPMPVPPAFQIAQRVNVTSTMVVAVLVNVMKVKRVIRIISAYLTKPVRIPANPWALFAARCVVLIVVHVAKVKCVKMGPVLKTLTVCQHVMVVVILPMVAALLVSVAMGKFVIMTISVSTMPRVPIPVPRPAQSVARYAV